MEIEAFRRRWLYFFFFFYVRTKQNSTDSYNFFFNLEQKNPIFGFNTPERHAGEAKNSPIRKLYGILIANERVYSGDLYVFFASLPMFESQQPNNNNTTETIANKHRNDEKNKMNWRRRRKQQQQRTHRGREWERKRERDIKYIDVESEKARKLSGFFPTIDRIWSHTHSTGAFSVCALLLALSTHCRFMSSSFFFCARAFNFDTEYRVHMDIHNFSQPASQLAAMSS